MTSSIARRNGGVISISVRGIVAVAARRHQSGISEISSPSARSENGENIARRERVIAQ